MKKNLGYFGLGILTVGVLLFLGKHSLNFFTFTFGATDEIYAWMGLLLTSIGAIIWLWIFKFTDGTRLQKTVALVMMFVSLAGEFITAGLDIYIQAMVRDGFKFAPDEIRTMSIVVSAFGLATGLALVLHFAGDAIIEEFKKDKDGDGIPDFADPVDNRISRQTTSVQSYAVESDAVRRVRANGNEAADPTNQPRR